MRSILLSMMALISLPQSEGAEPCKWNPLCTCRKSHHDVVCRSVSFALFPQIPLDDIYQVTIMRSGISTIENVTFEGTSVSSLHLIQNEISHISPTAFRGLENLLTTLDLSQNQLDRVPLDPLRILNNIQWLNLQGNSIGEVHSHGLNFSQNLTSLFLGDNRITAIDEGCFTQFASLKVLSLEGNLLHDVGSNCFPSSLSSLSLSNNLLNHVPLHALYTLRNVRFLHLSENLIKNLPCPLFIQTQKLEKLDLSNNLLSFLSECVFNGSFSIRELYLDFNFVRTLSARVFKFTFLERLSVTNNRILKIHSDAFSGVELTLTNLDLGLNLLEDFPSAVNDLKSLLYLSLKGNFLKRWNKGDLYGCRKTLEVLDLSGNRLDRVPELVLNSLLRLSLQDNNIEKVYWSDFQNWGHSLTTLGLANNKMKYLSEDVFFHLKKLRKLSLSFNNLLNFNPSSFYPLRKTIEVLELSSAFSQHSYPLDNLIEGLENLEFVLLDSNEINEISSSSIKTLKNIMHFEISNNNLQYLPRSLFSSLENSRLSTVRISNNKLGSLRYRTFHNLNSLSSVLLYNNDISLIEKQSFVNCSKLHTIVLSDCNITWIDESAFYNLSRLSNLYLQDNRLELFNFNVIGGITYPLNINLSNNCLQDLIDQKSTNEDAVVQVKMIDLTNNELTVISKSMLKGVSKHLQHLFISNNKISNITLGLLLNLQVFYLSHNEITDLNFSKCCPSLQVLSLDHNRIKSVERKAFWPMRRLRILDLSRNEIKFISEEAFTGTVIEKLNLSGNYIKEVPSLSLNQLRNSLRKLDLSFNKITSLLPGAFSTSNNLQALNLSSNQITSFHESSFQGMPHLLVLDLSHNGLRDKFRNVSFQHLPRLRSLHLDGCGLMTLQVLTLPLLRTLSLRDNFFYNISIHVLRPCCVHLEVLDVAGNFLKELPSGLWELTRKLVELDVSNNPISSLKVDSFFGLERLQRLNIQRLTLKWLDPRTLHCLNFLTSFKTDSYSSVRSFRLQELLSHSPAIRSVAVNIEESILSHQIQSAFGTKLRELSITGPNLQKLLPDAFAGLCTHELTIKISGTLVSRFPVGLLRYLSDVRYLTLDFRKNKLTEMSSGVLAEVTSNGLDDHQTQHITGGVLLEDNPWICSCELLWMGRWLRRWLRESFHIHMLSVEATLYVNSVTRKAQCTIPASNLTLAVVDLTADIIQCEKSSTSSLYCSSFMLIIFSLLLCFVVNFPIFLLC